MKALTPSQAKMFITNALLLKEIPYLAGEPAIGKSDIVFQIAEEFNLELIDVRLSYMLPEDIVGIPSLDAARGKAHYNPFDTFPLEGDPLPKGKDGWLIFLDELSSASEETMAGIYPILLGHKVGTKKIHRKAVIVGAGNRSTDSAIARPLPDTLITRMLPIEMKVSSKDWIAWARSLPKTESSDVVISFIEKYPDMLNSSINPSKREELETYNTPRGWGRMFKIVKLHERNIAKNQITKKDASGVPIASSSSKRAAITPDIQALMFSAVGVMVGQSFKEHYDESIQLPFPWEVAQSPSSAKIPVTTQGKAELTAMLADFFVDSNDQSRDSLLQYMNRMDPEYSSLFAEIISEKIGRTSSDVRLLEEVKKRLGVTPIDTNVGDGGPTPNP